VHFQINIIHDLSRSGEWIFLAFYWSSYDYLLIQKFSTFEEQYTIAFSLPIFYKIMKHLVISQEGTTTLHIPT